eukprot:6606493-Prymnesium_polylepis.1
MGGAGRHGCSRRAAACARCGQWARRGAAVRQALRQGTCRCGAGDTVRAARVAAARGTRARAVCVCVPPARPRLGRGPPPIAGSLARGSARSACGARPCSAARPGGGAAGRGRTCRARGGASAAARAGRSRASAR